MFRGRGDQIKMMDKGPGASERGQRSSVALKKTGLGFLLQHLRERRGLSLREFGQLADTDRAAFSNAYIYRLEQGEKAAPSDDVLVRLIRALKADRREAEMLRFLAAHPETAQELVVMCLPRKPSLWRHHSGQAVERSDHHPLPGVERSDRDL